MSDLISRQAVLDAFGLSEKTRKYGGDHSGYDTMMFYEIQDIIESLPSAEKTGHWIRITNGAMKEKYICSECGRQIEDDGIEGLLSIKYPYCHCGARMVEPQERSEKE